MSATKFGEPYRNQQRRVFSAERNLQDRQGNRPMKPALEAAAPLVVDSLAPVQALGTQEILAAIARVEEKLTRTVDIAPEVDKIQVEISEIAGRIKATKVEMAALRHPLVEENRFRKAADDLSEIVGATERATTQIIDSAEKMDEIAHELQSTVTDAYVATRLAAINDLVLQIYEACNFQDLTGQKIRKVVGTLAFIEERVDRMVAMWNSSDLASLPLPPSLDRVDGEVELHGPDFSGMSSQSDIDALFD